MRYVRWMILAALGVATFGLPALAQAEGRVTIGAMVWRHETGLQVDRATDYDGSNETAGERAKDWDVAGSGLGARLSYEFPRLVTVYGEAGTSQATVRDKEVVDPTQSVSSRGLNGGAYFAVGAQIGDYFSSTGNLYWRLGGSVSAISAGLDRDVNRSWDYDETRIAAEVKIGTWAQQVGLYGGLRLVGTNADLRETDLRNPVGQQTRLTEFSRSGAVDLVFGAQTRGSEINGFTEIGTVGTFSANAGLTMRF